MRVSRYGATVRSVGDMGWWSERAVPHLTDLALRGPEIGELREEACRGLHGRVLEIGFGSGLNLRFYPAAVTSVAAVEPSDVGWKLSRERRTRTGVPVHRSGLDGQHLAEDDASFDSRSGRRLLCPERSRENRGCEDRRADAMGSWH